MDVSIIIPTYNRKDAILETLSLLARVEYPSDLWEAVVIDDGSTDDTEEAVTRWINQADAPVKYLKQKNGGAAAARNLGATVAVGRALIFIDNDILVSPDFIQKHIQAIAENPGCWILGRVTHPHDLRQTPFGRYRDDFHESFYSVCPSDCLSETQGMTGQNISIPRSDFLNLRGFDESFPGASCEDWELGFRARQKGVKVLFHPGIIVLHNDWAVSLERFCERQRSYSIPQVLLWKQYGEKSPWAKLVSENGPLNWRDDNLKLSIKKVIKSLLATQLGRQSIYALCRIAENIAPDTRLNRRAYNLAVAEAIFRGVREGLRRDEGVSSSPGRLPSKAGRKAESTL